VRCWLPIVDIEAYSFTFEPIDERMYLLLCDGWALIVDPFVCDEAVQILGNKRIVSADVILTHEHFDHISGVNYFREQINCRVICTNECAIRIGSPKLNMAAHFDALFATRSADVRSRVDAILDRAYACRADVTFSGRMELAFARHSAVMTETRGHSKGSLFLLLDGKCLFSGDSLIARVPVVTRLPGGSRKEYEETALSYLRDLDEGVYVLPGHGEAGPLSTLFRRAMNE